MPAWSIADPEEFLQRDSRLHALLGDVPLHDVWKLELPGGDEGLTLQAVRRLMRAEDLTSANSVVRGLFRFRAALGRWLGWEDEESASDSERAVVPPESYLHRLTPGDRAASLEPPGSKDGPFTVLYVFANESVSEIRNATVHAFSAMVFERASDGYVAWWAIYVKPVGRETRFYMALIDPFRRHLVYPAILRQVHRAWLATYR